MTVQNQLLAAKLKPMRALVEKTARTTTEVSELPFFQLCLMSSFAKSFEFAELTAKQDPEGAFFLTAGLRSTTEELIFLNLLSDIPDNDRETVLENLLKIEIEENLEHQRLFMRRIRPFQPVLGNLTVDTESLKEEVRDVWQRNGWRHFTRRRGVCPPVREMAEKSESGILEIVYDFIYRLSSNAVHFRPSVLLRLGWKIEKTEWSFSSKSYSEYYLQVIRIYGCFLFCLYFELFEDFIDPSPSDKNANRELRNLLLQQPRWPEMVTFEEMNQPYPTVPPIDQFLHGVYLQILDAGFLSGAKKLLEN